ncbi:hypothetical protein MKX01_020870 [Papaver californicum]|nr:hypothetical protein MKX01_020870 [Papaver californicum]
MKTVNEGLLQKRTAQQFNVANVLLLCVVLVISICGSGLGSRTNPFSREDHVTISRMAPDADDGICKLRVEIFGYACEEHTVTTQDGYILSMQRIPVGKSGETSGVRPPVLLQHGVLMDGITWLLNTPDQSLAYILADNGFDVWIANTRGTKFSRGHTSLSPDDSPYWDWAWDQLVQYELPATFQYVHDHTNQKIHYVGHSLGTLVALASFSQQKLLNMLVSAALLSPIAYIGQMTSLLAQTAAKHSVAEAGYDEFDPNSKAVGNLLKDYCKKPSINCDDLMTTFTVEVFLENERQPTATKNMIHLAQMVREGTIRMYDYGGDEENKKHYGQSTPPVYDMTSIPNDLPLFLSYGGADALSDVNDVQLLLANLKDHSQDKLVVQYQDNYATCGLCHGC